MSEIVARTGWPDAPNTSQNSTGHACHTGSVGANVLQTLSQLRRWRAGGADAGQIAFHIGHEHGHAEARELFGDDLERDRLAGARGAGNQPVSVREPRQHDELGTLRSASDREWGGHGPNYVLGGWAFLKPARAAAKDKPAKRTSWIS